VLVKDGKYHILDYELSDYLKEKVKVTNDELLQERKVVLNE